MATTKTSEQIKAEGRKAYGRRQSADANPYSEGKNRQLWIAGYDEAVRVQWAKIGKDVPFGALAANCEPLPQAIFEGALAAERGDSTNPYGRGTKLRRAWALGHATGFK